MLSSISPGSAAAADPVAVLAAAAAAASLLTRAAPSGALTASQAAIAAGVAAAAQGGLAALQASGGGAANDGAVAATVAALAAVLGPAPSGLTADTAPAALGALTSAVTLLATSGGGALPAATGSSALQAMNGLLLSGSASGASTVVQSGSSALPSALVAGAGGLFDALAAAALGRQAPGNTTPLAFSSSLPAALAGSSSPGSFCGSALLLTVAQPPASGGAWALSTQGALPPCAASSVPPPNSAPVTLPPSIVSAQPPPSVAMPAALQADLLSRGAGNGVSLKQWGLSPHPENANLGLIPYPPLVKAGTLTEAAAAAASAAAAAVAPHGRRTSLLSTLTATFTGAVQISSGGLSSTGAIVTSNSILRAAVPRPLVAYDRDPSRPLDSRVFSVNALGSSGTPQRVTGLSTPLTITIPLRDLSIVQWSAAAGKAVGVNVGNASFVPRSFNVTCPRYVAPGAPIVVRAVYTAPRELAGRAAPVKIVSTSAASYLSPLAPEGGVQNVGLGAQVVSGVDGTDAPPLAAGDAAEVGVTLLMSVDCGAPWGNASFLCGPGMEGSAVAFSCPVLVSVPHCMWWDAALAGGSGGWSISGCAVAGLTETAVTCACSQFGDFAVRFATLDLPDNDLFAADSSQPLRPSSARLLFGMGCGVAAVTALFALFAEAREGGQRQRFAKHLEGDPEVRWLSRAVGGGAPLAELAHGMRESASVAPLGSKAEQPTQAAAGLVQLLGLGSARRGDGAGGGSAEIRAIALLLCGSLDPLRMTAEVRGEGGADAGKAAVPLPLPAAPLPPAPRMSGAAWSTFWALLWLRGASLGHPFLSWLRVYDASRPASLRVTTLGATIVLSLLFAVVAMVVLYGSAHTFLLQPLTPPRFAAIAALVGAAMPLLHAALRALVESPAGAAAWARRYPVLAAELGRRRAAAALLDGEGSGALLAGLRDCRVAPESLQGDGALRGAVMRDAPLPLFARPPAALLRSMHAAALLPRASPLPPAGAAPEEAPVGITTHLSHVQEGLPPPSAAPLASPPRRPPTLNDVFEAWEEAHDSPPQPPRCCAARLRAHKRAVRAQFEEFCADTLAADDGSSGSDGAAYESSGGGAWEGAAAPNAHGVGLGEAEALLRLQLAESWRAVAAAASQGSSTRCSCGGALLAWAGHAALWTAVGLSLQVLGAFDGARDASASKALLLAWLSGLALGAIVCMPLATALSLAWQLYAWPLLVAPAAAPWAARARAQEKALRSAALPTREALEGRLQLLLRGLAAAQGAQLPSAEAICVGVSARVIALALHGRAHCGAYAVGAAAASSGGQQAPLSAHAGAFRNEVLVARVAVVAGVAVEEGRAQSPPLPPPPPPPPPALLDSPPPPHHDWQRRGLNMQWAVGTPLAPAREDVGGSSSAANPGAPSSAAESRSVSRFKFRGAEKFQLRQGGSRA